jgi:hypothetical protein
VLSNERGGIFATLCAINVIGGAVAGVYTFYNDQDMRCKHKNMVFHLVMPIQRLRFGDVQAPCDMSRLKTVGLSDSCAWPPVEGRYRPTRSALRLHVAIVILLAYLARMWK